MGTRYLFVGAAISLVVLYSDRTILLAQIDTAPTLGAAMPVVTQSLPKEVFYHSLQPEIVLNYGESDPHKFIMVDFSVATNQQSVLDVLDDRDAELRSTLLTLLSEKDARTVNTSSGKQALRDEAKVRLEEIVGFSEDEPLIKDVLITRMIVR